MDLIASSGSSDYAGLGKLLEFPLYSSLASSRLTGYLAKEERPFRLRQKQTQDRPAGFAEKGCGCAIENR
jgi:hypothetical protein